MTNPIEQVTLPTADEMIKGLEELGYAPNEAIKSYSVDTFISFVENKLPELPEQNKEILIQAMADHLRYLHNQHGGKTGEELVRELASE